MDVREERKELRAQVDRLKAVVARHAACSAELSN
jgi:hypothetical protein